MSRLYKEREREKKFFFPFPCSFHSSAGRLSNPMVRTLIATILFAICFVLSQAASLESRSAKKSGHATFYSVKKSGEPSCGGKADNDDLVVALSKHRMGKKEKKLCGEKIKVQGKTGSVTVKVIDTCPECDKNDIDLSPAAFKKIAHKKDGRVKVKWSFK